MSKENNLKDYLTDLYQGIKSKKPGASRNPQNFRSEIEQIETKSPEWDGSYETSPDTEIVGGECPAPNIVDISNEPIINNGTYEASELVSGADGIGKFTVAVPAPEVEEPKLIPKTVTENGTYLASGDGADGYESVTVAVPIPDIPEVTTEEKTVTPTKSMQEVTPTGADYLSKVTVNPIPDSYIQPSGNLEITENDENIDVAQYETVKVNVPTGGGSSATLKGLIEGTLTEISDDSVTEMPTYAFVGKKIERYSFPNVKTLDFQSFWMCDSIKSLDFPSVETIRNEAFMECDSYVEELTLPSVKIIYFYGLYDFWRLKRLDLPCVEKLGQGAFQYCQSLESVTIGTPSVCEFGMDVFGNLDDWGVEDFTETSLRIYVPAYLVDAYKSATNSAEYADIILPEEE